MCGITGWVDFGRDLRGQRAAIEAMTATMICRGPDAGAVWCSAHAAIGHRRLSVIDLPGGEQPMRAPGEDGVVLTFSGEIYNFTELRRELAARGRHFRTRSDTEVLLHGYLEWGADCVRRLNGMFAFGVWDGRRQELLLARDRLGVKPLYYALQTEGVLFGSEPKAVLAHPQFRAEIDSEGLAELFSQVGTATPGHGLYRGLCQVRPGDHAKLATFSVDFTGSADAFTPDQLRPSHDEPFARAAAGYIGSRHGTITLEAEDLVTAQWAPLAAHDLPTFGDMYISFVLLCREISKQSTVALSGEAADEVFGGYPWYHVPALLAAPTFPRWLPFLLDRKDRLIMASGLEVRVPFTDHRLVEYVWNVPWPVKEAGGIEKGLLRTAANGLLPADLLRRRKSIYPGAADQAYERAIDAQLHQLLAQPDAPLFDLISRERLTAAYSADPRLPGLMSVQPSSTSPVAYLLDVNRWLERSGVTIR